MFMSTTDSKSTEQAIETLRGWIEEAPDQSIVFFGGAGVSTESGIPDFRSPDGLYAQKYRYPPETIISRSFFNAHPDEFFDFYCDRMIALDAQPNQAHKKLAELEAQGKLLGIVTQNIDGLHQKAGSQQVYELHGSVLRNYGMKDHQFYSVEELMARRKASADGVPRDSKGGIIKPDVVLYEEPLSVDVMEGAMEVITQADLLIVAGTSLVVNPAASFVRYFNGSHLAIINLSPTPLDHKADLCLAVPVGQVMNF